MERPIRSDSKGDPPEGLHLPDPSPPCLIHPIRCRLVQHPCVSDRPLVPLSGGLSVDAKNSTVRPFGGGSPASWRARPPGAQARPDCGFFSPPKIIRRRKNRALFFKNINTMSYLFISNLSGWVKFKLNLRNEMERIKFKHSIERLYMYS